MRWAENSASVSFTRMVEVVQADGREIAYSVVGDGPDLVLLNGFAATTADWDPTFVAALAAANRVILIDHRGMGASPDDGQPFSIADLASDVGAVIDEVADGSAALLGWSMGGFIAQACAATNPAQLNRLVLLSTDTGGPDSVYNDEQELAQIADLSPEPIEQARMLLNLLFPAEVAQFIFGQFGQLVADARASLNADVLARQFAAIQQWRRDASPLGAFAGPILAATGAMDAVIPPANSRQLIAQSQSAWLAEFPGGGHAFMAQFPNELASVINTFLAI